MSKGQFMQSRTNGIFTYTVFDILESTLTLPKRGRVDQDALQKILMADII